MHLTFPHGAAIEATMKLTYQEQVFIVRALACFQRPSEVAEAFRAEFGRNIPRQQVAFYDPTKGGEAKRLPERLQVIFWAARTDFVEDMQRVRMSNRSYQLQQLDKLCRKAERAGDYLTAAKCLEIAAKICGGWYGWRMEDMSQPQQELAKLVKFPTKRKSRRLVKVA
jgi:hypothetical protein